MSIFGGDRDISLFRHINRELINNIIDTKVDIVKAAIKDIKENLYGEALGKQYFQNVRVGCLIEQGSTEIEDSEFGPDVNKDVTSIIGTNPAVKDILRENLNRMIRYGLNPKNGNTVDEIMASFQKQISNPKFLKEVVPLISEKVKIQKYITGLNKSFGLNLDSVNISHKKAVARDKELTLAIENIFIGSAKKNTAESAIQKKISSSTDIKEIKKLEGQIKDEGLLDPISPNYPSPDTVSADAAKKIKEGASQAMTGDPLYYKKNGGMMNINDITGPLGKFSSQI